MWSDQEDQRPSTATATKGAAFIERTVDRLADYMEEMIVGTRVAEVPPFFE